jgi:50S ribosomal subunit-associated GTPase HflX
VANKIDLLPDSENFEELARRFPYIKVIPISAQRAEGIDAIRDELRTWLAESPAEVLATEPAVTSGGID